MVFRGQDLWRKHPIFRWRVTDALPGLREGAGAFGLYLAAEWVYKKFNGADEEDHHAAPYPFHAGAVPHAKGGAGHADHSSDNLK